ncbi:hypothetical protein, partial [Neisseria bacilliformis]|uniref:hypothetical protein n=1 Tax=Neisseria bacilliformis TaxID=267212 RepID=UPI003C734187
VFRRPLSIAPRLPTKSVDKSVGKLWASGKNPLPATARAALPKKHTNYKTFKIKQIKQNPHQRPSEKANCQAKQSGGKMCIKPA